MVYVKRLQGRGATVVVEANAEVLFVEGALVGRWAARLRERTAAAAVALAPSNKRPRWGHYGAPLKNTIKRTSKYQPSRMKIYSAVGAAAPHAYYVDQGTGIFAGNGPYVAKVLPPWQRGEGSLYEHTWSPAGPGGRTVVPVLIKGQKGQFFLDAAIKAGFRSMRLRSAQLPGEGAGAVSKAINSAPSGLENFLGNTPNDGAFRASRNEWRKWRDDAFNAGEGLGRKQYPQNRLKRRASREQQENMQAYLASVRAAEVRAAQQAQKLRDKADRKRKGEERQRERDRKLREANALRRGNAAERKQAEAYYNRIKEAYPNATFGTTTLADGVILFRVSYNSGGETHIQQWAYGYAV